MSSSEGSVSLRGCIVQDSEAWGVYCGKDGAAAAAFSIGEHCSVATLAAVVAAAAAVVPGSPAPRSFAPTVLAADHFG